MENRKSKNIVCLALPAWEAPYLRSTVELMQGLALTNKVLYVDYAYTIKDCINAILGKRKLEWQRLLGIKKRLRKISGDGETGLYLLSLPPIFPAFVTRRAKLFNFICRLNAAITGVFINRAIRKLKMDDVTGFNAFQPFLGRYWKIDNLTFNVYYIYDDFTNVPWFNGFVPMVERDFLKQVDLIIVTSAELKRRSQACGLPIEVVNNGVHFDAFNLYAKPESNNGTPTVGYTGSIDNRIDINLLEPVVAAMPHIRFKFIGKVFDQQVADRLAPYPNVEFHPPVPAHQIPELQSHLQAGIVPYVRTALTAAIYPLKVNEYLAMGLPVVMTPFASVGNADKVVYIGENSEAFAKALLMALNNNQHQREKRISIAKNADWGARVQQLNSLIEKYKLALQ